MILIIKIHFTFANGNVIDLNGFKY